MTIRPGAPWGEVVSCPDVVTTVADDAELGRWLADGDGGPVRVLDGDLVRTVGRAAADATCRRYEIDTLRVVLDGDELAAVVAVGHVVIRGTGPLGWWRGRLWAAMNVSRIGGWDVAPRAHPNDGVADVVTVDAAMPVRQRLQAARRLRTGTHVPHPMVSIVRTAAATWAADTPHRVFVDGRPVGVARRVEVTVVPDAAVIHV